MTLASFEHDQKATLLDYDAVMEHIKLIARSEETFDVNNVKDLSKSLTLFFLQSYFPDLDSSGALDCIVDGSNDQGFDAIYIEEADDKNIVHIVQTKLVTSRDKVLEKKFSGNELVKFTSKFDDYVVHGKYSENANESLKIKLDEISRLTNRTFNIILLSPGTPPSSQATEEFFAKIDQYNLRKKYVDATFIGLGTLADMLPDIEDPKIDITMRFEGHVIETKGGRVQNVVIGRVLGSQIATLVKQRGMELFAKNVRGYLRVKNKVNTDIYSSATHSDLAPYFFVLNNGITIVCDDIDYMSQTQSPEIKISGAQIVNGGQTSNTLYEALKNNKLDPNVQVLVRLIETRDREVLDKVTKATNHQTSVRTRDLRSNDPIQKRIEQYIKDKYNYYYEARKNKYQGAKSTKLRIDMEYAAQSYFAYEMQEPVFAKSSKAKLFDDEYYDQIFNADTPIDHFFFIWKLRKSLEDMRKKYLKSYGFVRDAELTSLAVFRSFASDIQTLPDLDRSIADGSLESYYKAILEATQQVVGEEIAKQGDKFEKRRFFISPTTLGRIEERLNLTEER